MFGEHGQVAWLYSNTGTTENTRRRLKYSHRTISCRVTLSLNGAKNEDSWSLISSKIAMPWPLKFSHHSVASVPMFQGANSGLLWATWDKLGWCRSQTGVEEGSTGGMVVDTHQNRQSGSPGTPHLVRLPPHHHHPLPHCRPARPACLPHTHPRSHRPHCSPLA